ncbi:MAG: DUF1851 domain-containing protein [Clostridiales Family XIII bacterium]|nr:DUF1851 domain-containing protein [Clostridiales Family XIII bacterium]
MQIKFPKNRYFIKQKKKYRWFKKAVSKNGHIAFDEIYYFVPALMMGGKEDIKNAVYFGAGTAS